MIHNRKTKMSLFLLALILLYSTLSACSQQEVAEDPNKEVVQKVLELQFDGVDEKMNEYLKTEYWIVKDGRGQNPEFEKYIDETYGPYFTEDGLDIFISAFGGTQYPTLAYDFGYMLSLEDVTIEHDETTANRYDFTAKVGYQKDGSTEETAEVKGVILFSTKEESKIGKFQYGDDGGLANILNESN